MRVKEKEGQRGTCVLQTSLCSCVMVYVCGFEPQSLIMAGFSALERHLFLLLTVSLSLSVSVSLSRSLSVCLSLSLFLCLCLSVCFSLCVSLCLSVSVCLSVCLFLSLCLPQLFVFLFDVNQCCCVCHQGHDYKKPTCA